MNNSPSSLATSVKMPRLGTTDGAACRILNPNSIKENRMPVDIETKFDLQRPFLSGLGSFRDFFGFSGGHGVISRLRLETRAPEAVWCHILRNRSLRA